MELLDNFSFADEHSQLTPKENFWKILIVGHEEDIHTVTRMALRRLVFEGYNIEFLTAHCAADAKEILHLHSNVAVILLDVVMGDDTALSLVNYIRRDLENTRVRIILRTNDLDQTLDEQVIISYDISDYREKVELTPRCLRTSIVTALRSFRDLSLINTLKLEIQDTQNELVFSLGKIAESRSSETSNHLKRVGKIAEILASRYNLPDSETKVLRLAASMHDLGKLAIHDSILAKPGTLTLDEVAIMKTHAEMGYEMLKNSENSLLQTAAIIAHQHHENYDGTGYPLGLKGQEIHLYSRIVTLADVFDALGNYRAYKIPWTNDKIKNYLKEQAGRKFDPQIVTLLLQNFSAISSVREILPDHEL